MSPNPVGKWNVEEQQAMACIVSGLLNRVGGRYTYDLAEHEQVRDRFLRMRRRDLEGGGHVIDVWFSEAGQR